ncbi:transcriptional activator hac1 [Colletotrichum scovillei]|uniref:Transcriptional activator hac1 n=1 Tax=Colletotrichum scovillei TaxID=1209932 RepID=A0A9P7UI68_9PEZI|nr:transcriptional activator hac1 [Colletotrichum scovillei]KAG7076680.1 transcriptional activator hac1 [Colletotrichum scovillei]KAG7083782.1 transcriptional activator hac1 [Colletotrichum scovillei]
MASWEQPSPMIKFEDSPAESFVSTPGEIYPSLFGDANVVNDDTLDPSDMMTPPPFNDDGGLPASTASTPAPDGAGSSSPDKKQTKKRKSWGQVLPEPKTNLPPRKRAKTEDEKEQRRVERVLRNRRAAQSSRERKRLEVEALERRNKELESALQNVTKANQLLVDELNKFRRDSGMLTRSTSPNDPLHKNSVTLSQELFSSHDGHRASLDETKSIVDDLMTTSQPNATVNPASLSPELSPIAEGTEEGGEEQPTAETSVAKSTSDLTQRPAAMLCDLQCHLSEELPQSWLASQTPLHPTLVFFLQLQTLLVTSSVILSVCQRPLTQIAMSLKAGFSLPPTPSIMNTIIWLVTLPSSKTRSTSTSSSTTTSTAQPSQRTRISAATSPTLRLKSLQRILTCSPTLARPLMDATMEALRLVSEGCDDRIGGSSAGSSAQRDSSQTPQTWIVGAPLPSREVLLTLLWVLRVEERKINRKNTLQLRAHSPDLVNDISTPTNNHMFVSASKRKRGVADTNENGKRFRLA